MDHKKLKEIFYKSCAQNDFALLKQLNLSGLTLEEKNSGFILACRIRKSNLEIVELLIKCGINLETKNKTSGTTALIYASENGNLELVQLLIKFGVNLEAKSYDGYNAFIVACERGYLKIVDLLINAGINVELTDNHVYGYTGFIWACRWGYFKIVLLLIQSGKVNLEVEGKNGYTGLICACQSGHLEIVELLIQSGVSIDPNNVKLQKCFSKIAEIILISPLYFERKSKILFLLLEYGLNVKIFNKIGQPKNKKQNELYDKLKQIFQVKIQENKLMKETLKNLFIDVEMVIIDEICNFTNGHKNLENCF